MDPCKKRTHKHFPEPMKSVIANKETAIMDLATTNLNLAVGLPGSEMLDVAAYLRRLEEADKVDITDIHGHKQPP